MRRLNWIGIAIFGVGVGVAALGSWYVIHARPEVGAEIDTIALDGDHSLVVFAEKGGDRSFVELHTKGELEWQALIPRYAGAKGRPAVAFGAGALTVRVERGGRSEVFAFHVADGEKLGGFRMAVEHEPVSVQPTGPITLTDHVRSYELVGGATWHEVVAVDLASGEALWKAELGAEPVTDGRVGADGLEIRQGDKVTLFDAATGHDKVVAKTTN